MPMKRLIFYLQKYDDQLLLILGLAIALAIRFLLRSFITGDAVVGFFPWYEYIESMGGIPALGHGFSGYTPLYLYMLTLSYYVNRWLDISVLTVVKIIPIFFDFFGAFWLAKIVQIKYPGKTIGGLAALAYLFLPTVFINSAMWGQIDSIHTSFMLASLYFLLKRRDNWAMIAFGLGMSIKFQTIFMAPALLILVLLGYLSFASIFLIPAVYIITILPAWALGRSIWELLTLFLFQVNSFEELTLNAPTLYALFSNSAGYLLNTPAILLAIAIVMLAVFAVYKMRPTLDPGLIIHLCACAVLLTPYVLPKMHERYFYTAEVFCLLLAFYRPRLAFLVIGLQVAALSTYDSYLFGNTFLSLTNASLLMLAILVWLIYDLVRILAPRSVNLAERS
jgi:Gpi18-like mannosyltransferase